MINKLKTFVAVAALSGSLGANVYAAMQDGGTPQKQSNLHQTSVEKITSKNSLITDRIYPDDVKSTANYTAVKQNQTTNNKLAVLQPDKLITNLVQPAVNDFNKATAGKPVTANPVVATAGGVVTSSVLQPAPVTADVAPTTAQAASPALVTADAAPAVTDSPAAVNIDQSATNTASETPATTDNSAAEPAASTDSTGSDAASADTTAAPAAQAAADSQAAQADPSSAPANTDPAPAPAPKESTPAPAPAPAPKESAPAANQDPSVQKVITVKATAYTASCDGCSGVTATGINIKANPDEKVIAVDPKVIPLGSKVYVEGVGYATAADTGGAIKGNRIDVFIPTEQEALKFGVKQLSVKILN